jgi:UDP:flavonoid glycosyltransferase YjiC (YdhE family)
MVPVVTISPACSAASPGPPHRGVMATGREQLAPPPAAELLWQSNLPLHRLLPRSATLVHHGGIGTTAEALRAAVPQLVLPWAVNQFDNAERVRALGVALTLPSRRLRPDLLLRALGQLLDSTRGTGSPTARAATPCGPVTWVWPACCGTAWPAAMPSQCSTCSDAGRLFQCRD